MDGNIFIEKEDILYNGVIEVEDQHIKCEAKLINGETIYFRATKEGASDLGLYTFPINFDITADWSLPFGADKINRRPVTDEASFIEWLTDGGDDEDGTNDFTNIIVKNFKLENERLTCNLTAEGTTLAMGYLDVTEFNSCGDIDGLLNIYLFDNQLTEFNPDLPLPDSLIKLFISGNQLTEFNPDLPLPDSLVYLYISSNQLTEFNPDLPLPDTLTRLNISYNQLTEFNPDLPLPDSLEILDIINNLLTEFNPTIPLPVSLTELYIINNQLTEFNPTIPLPDLLTKLYIDNNQLTEFNPDLPLPDSLTMLNVRNNQITTQGWTNSEVWATAQPSFINNCVVYCNNNTNSVNGTNFKSILEGKNCTVVV